LGCNYCQEAVGAEIEMSRFFVSAEELQLDRVSLSKEDSHHLLRVMRADVGASFIALTGGQEYSCILTETVNGRAYGRVVSSNPAAGEPSAFITLFQGLAKGEKVESVIQHGTEVGISEFVPVVTSRAVVKLEAKKAIERVERWQRIARDAAEQSKRGALPRVTPIATWREATDRCPEFDLALVPWEEGGEPLRTVLERTLTPEGRAMRVAVFIGPEGGLAGEEVARAKEKGAVAVTLGPRILRTEMAGLATAVAILYHRGDLG